jgi:hypothetical protein
MTLVRIKIEGRVVSGVMDGKKIAALMAILGPLKTAE